MSKKLYIARANDYFKIGISENPEERIKQLQTGNPEPVDLYAEFEAEDAAKCESRLHKRFEGFRIQGEWFKLDVRIVDGIINLYNDTPASMDEIVDWVVRAHKVTLYVVLHSFSQVNAHDINIWQLNRAIVPTESGEGK